MNRIGRYMEPQGGPLSWYSTMKNINDKGDRDFYQNIGRKPSSGVLSKIKNMFSQAQGPSPQYDKIQRPGLLGLGNFSGRGGFFKQFQNLFLDGKSNVHAVRRHHHFRNPEEGASRPGFITSAPQSERPGFISGLSAASADTGAEILKESKSALSKMSLMFIVVGLVWYFKMR